MQASDAPAALVSHPLDELNHNTLSNLNNERSIMLNEEEKKEFVQENPEIPQSNT